MNNFTGQLQEIGRQQVSLAPSLTASLETTPAIDFRGASGGMITIPTGSSITSLTFYGACAADGEFAALYGADGDAIGAITVAAARSVDLPAALFGAAFVKIVADAAGAVAVSLKG